jgi:membrane fusion protein (multidrug efflux system)
MMVEWRAAAVAASMASLLWAVPGSVAAQGLPPPAVLFQPAELKPLSEQFEFIGRAAALNKVDLQARVKGELGPRKFTDGDDVKEGQILFTIERDPYQAAVDQAVARRDAAKAVLANAEVQLQRAADLLRTNTGTRATYDQRLSEQLQAKAQVEDTEAQLRDAEIKLSYTEIHSPITGRIGRAAVSPGNIVGPDSGVLATVVSVHPMRVLFPVTQRQLLDARRDAAAGSGTAVVRLRLADGSIYSEKGRLDFLDVTVDPKTDTQIAGAVFDNQKGLLTDGQTLRVIIEGEKVPTVVAIPQAAIAIDQAGSYVFLVDDKSAVEQRRIKTSFTRDGLVAVPEGLKAGDKVIVQGQQRVRPGMTVTATPFSPPSAAKQ